MSGTYRSVLPEVFPYVVQIPADKVAATTQFLAAARPGIPCGSSFAVTSDVSGGTSRRNLWLSEASYRSLQEAGFTVTADETPKKMGGYASHEYRPDFSKSRNPCRECGFDRNSLVHT